MTEHMGHNQVKRLFDLQQLDIEDQLGVGGDAGKSLLAVCEVRRNCDTALATRGHASNTDVPALDDFTLAQLEGERLALLVGVEDLAVLELANVPHGDNVATLSSSTLAELLVIDLHTLDLLDTEGTSGLVAVGGRTLLEVLGELDLLVGLGVLLGLDRSGFAVVLLELLLLGLGQSGLLFAGLALGTLGHHVVKTLLVRLGSALVLALALGLNQLGGLLLLVTLDLGDSGVLHLIKVVALVVLHGHDLIHVELILIGGQVVVILIIFIKLRTALIETNNVVAGEVDGVVTGGLEEDTLTLTDGNVEGLLEVLRKG